MEETRTGGCLCGGIRLKTAGALRRVTACHCSQCRRQTGLYYAATSLRLDHLTIMDEGKLQWYRASEGARRGFCSVCGSALFWQADGDEEISVMAGAFDQPSGLQMGEHIFCADKGDFYDLPEDGLPRHPASRSASSS